MPDRAFLTDRRREFLEGDYDLDKAKDRQLKKRIKDDSSSALRELIEVAESPHIDTREVFDTDDVFRLLRALLTPNQEDLDSDEFVNIPTPEKYSDEYRAYCDRLYVQMDKLMHPYRDGRFPDPDTE